VTATPEQIEAWKQEILDLKSGWEFAFAHMAECCGPNDDPRLVEVVERVAQLNALIAEHAA
jgi:hypothetical protein